MCSRRLDRVFRSALLLLACLVSLPLAASGVPAEGELMQASTSYRQQRDSSSLERIHHALYRGMRRVEVEGLLGEPDYSPLEGQYYYASRWNQEAREDPAPTLVVDYRDAQGEPTVTLHDFWLGEVGE
jgi:hypothetical protein